MPEKRINFTYPANKKETIMLATEFNSYLLQKKTWVIDGATGTNLLQRGLPAGSAPETWLLENPDGIIQLHRDFIESGSDIILTCTFGGTRTRLAHANLGEQVEEINHRAVELARKAAAGSTCLVAGSIGPSGEMLEPYGSLSAEIAFDIFQQQAMALLSAGVDLLVIETQFDLNEAQAAIQAVRCLSEIALVVSFSYDRGKRTMMGLKPESVVSALAGINIQAIGVNCGKSLETNLEVLRELNELTTLPLWFKPNAGAPQVDELGRTHYHISPQEMGAQAKIWVENGARLVGGCCGTSPAHLQAIAHAVHVD